MTYIYKNNMYDISYTITRGTTTFQNMLNTWRNGDNFSFKINTKIISIKNDEAICGYFPIQIYFLLEENIKQKTMKIIEENCSYKVFLLIKDNSEQDNNYYINFII